MNIYHLHIFCVFIVIIWKRKKIVCKCSSILICDFRIIDAGYHFLFVWYYCTLTIREHILKVNGSKIKGWWLAHHFITTAAAGVFLVWPDGVTYWSFRDQFVLFCAYLSVVQVVQFYYQTGILYRLRALGVRNEMDITLEGFHSWMFKGFSFLLPFLFFGYAFQFYNSYQLYLLWLTPQCTEWQVPFLSLIFLFIAIGNTGTTLLVMKNRYLSKFSDFFSRNQYRLDMSKAKSLWEGWSSHHENCTALYEMKLNITKFFTALLLSDTLIIISVENIALGLILGKTHRWCHNIISHGW